MMEMDIIGHVINGFQLKIREALITRKITTVEKMIEHANLTRQKDINNQEDMFNKKTYFTREISTERPDIEPIKKPKSKRSIKQLKTK